MKAISGTPTGLPCCLIHPYWLWDKMQLRTDHLTSVVTSMWRNMSTGFVGTIKNTLYYIYQILYFMFFKVCFWNAGWTNYFNQKLLRTPHPCWKEQNVFGSRGTINAANWQFCLILNRIIHNRNSEYQFRSGTLLIMCVKATVTSNP